MQAEELDGSGLDEAVIAAYLRADPDFFVKHPGLLTELNLPHASGRAVSLVEHQVAIMRERNVEMRRRMNELLETARKNDTLFTKTRSLTLALVEAGSWQALNEVLATYVLVDFDADFLCAHVPAGDDGLDHVQVHDGELPFAHLLRESATLCTLRKDELAIVFPNSDAAEEGSAVLLPLELPAGLGALCIGSKDPQHFGPSMDTLFVTFIADVLSKVLARL